MSSHRQFTFSIIRDELRSGIYQNHFTWHILNALPRLDLTLRLCSATASGHEPPLKSANKRAETEDQCELVLSPLLPTASYTGTKCQWGELIHIQCWITAADSTLHAALRWIQVRYYEGSNWSLLWEKSRIGSRGECLYWVIIASKVMYCSSVF